MFPPTHLCHGGVGQSTVRPLPAMKPSRMSGRYCKRLSRLRTRASSRSRATTERLARLRLTCAQTHSTGEVGQVSGKQEHRQPGTLGDQLAHGVGDVGVQAIPDQYDRLHDELVNAVDQCDEVALAHAAALASARGVGAQAVAQPGTGAGAHGDQPGHRQASRAAAADRHDRGTAPSAPGPSSGRTAGEACLALEADVAPAGRPRSFTSAQVASFQEATACSSRSAIRRAGT